MAIESVSMMNPAAAGNAIQPERTTPFSSQQAFGTMLKDAINEVNAGQKESDAMTAKLIQGEKIDLHEVMIASQKASVTLNTTIQIRNKMIEAYQEVMRMPV